MLARDKRASTYNRKATLPFFTSFSYALVETKYPVVRTDIRMNRASFGPAFSSAVGNEGPVRLPCPPGSRPRLRSALRVHARLS